MSIETGADSGVKKKKNNQSYARACQSSKFQHMTERETDIVFPYKSV